MHRYQAWLVYGLIFDLVKEQNITSNQVIELLLSHGWSFVRQRGSHRQYKHPAKSDRVTVPHPEKDLPKGTVNSILKQAGLK